MVVLGLVVGLGFRIRVRMVIRVRSGSTVNIYFWLISLTTFPRVAL